MKKILFISMGESFGGIEKQELEIYKNIRNYKIEFLTPVKIFNLDNEHTLNISRNNLLGKIKYNYRLYKYLKKNKYDIIHINSSIFLYSFQVALIAKITKNKIIVVESHSIPYNSKLKKILIKVLKPVYNRLISKSLACSKETINSLYLEDTIILNNGINVEDYKYSESLRKKYRNNLNINNDTVYGTIGRIDKNKNYLFLIDLFNKIQKENNNSKLLIIGTGPEEELIKEKIKELKLNDKVILLGQRIDIRALLSSMDVFIFPSLKEGFGLSILESLTSGLPTIINSNIPINIETNNLYKVDNYNINSWIKVIKKVKHKERYNSYKEIKDKGYDIKNTTKELTNIYKDLIK